MSIALPRKQEIIKDYARKEGDTGSPEVQVAVLSERIKNLSEHLATHTKESPSTTVMRTSSSVWLARSSRTGWQISGNLVAPS